MSLRAVKQKTNLIIIIKCIKHKKKAAEEKASTL